jgi:hypothetical protein
MNLNQIKVLKKRVIVGFLNFAWGHKKNNIWNKKGLESHKIARKFIPDPLPDTCAVKFPLVLMGAEWRV